MAVCYASAHPVSTGIMFSGCSFRLYVLADVGACVHMCVCVYAYITGQ